MVDLKLWVVVTGPYWRGAVIPLVYACPNLQHVDLCGQQLDGQPVISPYFMEGYLCGCDVTTDDDELVSSLLTDIFFSLGVPGEYDYIDEQGSERHVHPWIQNAVERLAIRFRIGGRFHLVEVNELVGLPMEEAVLTTGFIDPGAMLGLSMSHDAEKKKKSNQNLKKNIVLLHTRFIHRNCSIPPKYFATRHPFYGPLPPSINNTSLTSPKVSLSRAHLNSSHHF